MGTHPLDCKLPYYRCWVTVSLVAGLIYWCVEAERGKEEEKEKSGEARQDKARQGKQGRERIAVRDTTTNYVVVWVQHRGDRQHGTAHYNTMQ